MGGQSSLRAPVGDTELSLCRGVRSVGHIVLRIELLGDARNWRELLSPLALLMGIRGTPQRQQLNGHVAPPRCSPFRGEKPAPGFVRSRRRACPMTGSAAPLPLPWPQSEQVRDRRLA